MSVTYHTPNRLRRQVMTAPLPELPQTPAPAVAASAPEAVAVAPRRGGLKAIAIGFVCALAGCALVLLR